MCLFFSNPVVSSLFTFNLGINPFKISSMVTYTPKFEQYLPSVQIKRRNTIFRRNKKSTTI
jgi:hypothetical protein